MQRKMTSLMLVAACLIVTGSSACGSQAESSSGLPDPCVIKSRGSVSRIEPENSDLSCTSIRSILKILPNATGVWPLDDNQGNPVWVCRVFPRAALPQEVRCSHDQRHFEKVRASAKHSGA
jgi:hypothetical protein